MIDGKDRTIKLEQFPSICGDCESKNSQLEHNYEHIMMYLLYGLLLVSLPNNFNGKDLSEHKQAITRDTSNWTLQTTAGLFFAQHGYSEHYKGGGLNSTALSNQIEVLLDFTEEKKTWNNRITARYGIIKISDYPLQKNQDHLEIDSKYSHQVSKCMRISGVFNFNTKFHDFYELEKNGERGKMIGNFLSPAYINIGSGIDYLTKDKSLSIFYTPLNSKVTIVKDQSLALQYLPEKYASRGARYEVGSLIRLELKKEILKNVTVHSIGNFFTNHLKDFGNFDVRIDNQFNFKVNKLLSFNLRTSLIYDEDIQFAIAEDSELTNTSKKGPRTQFKEILNIGLSHTF